MEPLKKFNFIFHKMNKLIVKMLLNINGLKIGVKQIVLISGMEKLTYIVSLVHLNTTDGVIVIKELHRNVFQNDENDEKKYDFL